MSLPAPPLDDRSAEDIQAQLKELLAIYAPTLSASGSGASAALIGIFARYAELVIERLNRAPDKNRLAFFDLVGATPLPPQAARVPLSFSLAPGATGAIVPARTPVAVPAGPEHPQPLLFETERELALTTARLARIISWDAVADKVADCSEVLASGAPADQVLFQGREAIGRYLYVGQARLLGVPNVSISYVISVAPELPAVPEPRQVEWQVWDGVQGLPAFMHSNSGPYDQPGDDTQSLTQSNVLQFTGLSEAPEVMVAGQVSRWLRCQLKTPLSPVLRNQLSVLTQMGMYANGTSEAVLPDASFFDQTPIDPSKDFFPFGTAASPGATWYIASREVFSKSAPYILHVIAPPSSTYPRATAKNVQLIWEYWTGADWTRLVEDQGSGSYALYDPSIGLTSGSGDTDQSVRLVFSQPAQLTRVNGIENYWLRVRFVSGAYATGVDATTGGAPRVVPPALARVGLNYRLASGSIPESPDALVRFDGMRYEVLDASRISADLFAEPDQAARDASRVSPFVAQEDLGRSVYFGFDLPGTIGAFPQRAVSLYFDLTAPSYGDQANNSNAASPPLLSWSYWAGDQGWKRLLVRDETGALNFSGLIEFLPPFDFSTRELFDRSACYWLRLSWTGGDYRYLPRLRRVLQNAAMAVQASTVVNEILGSSNGAAGQVFAAARKPVLGDVQLQVRESQLPSTAERAALEAEEGDDAITPLPDAGGGWVRWHEVGDFHGSGPRDRHYVLDHLSGEVRFGDGISGLIPARGAGNIRLARYSSGGGDGGNAAAGAITQMKTTVPFVASVSNPIAASGGVVAETLDALLDRAPRSIRHRGRAVTIEDFEDLARLASPEVARSRCVPLLDLRTPQPQAKVGQLSLIIVPVSGALKPTPSAELIERVRSYLDARRLPGIDLFVLGAEYVSVNVNVEVGLKDLSMAREVELAVRDALDGFLHPLTGGFDGRGWDFGRHPHRSDLFALLEAIDGVDYVRTLAVSEITDPKDPDANTTDRFLVCSGNHSVDLYYGV